MLGIGPLEWVVLLALGLVVVGPRKLPEVARTVGRWTRELRQVTRDLRLTLEVELDEEETRRRRVQINERREALAADKTDTLGPVAAAEAITNDALPVATLPDIAADSTAVDEAITADDLPAVDHSITEPVEPVEPVEPAPDRPDEGL